MTADWPLPCVTSLDSLGPPGDVLSRNDGESLEVRRLHDHPGWLLKTYRQNSRSAKTDEILDRLVRLPSTMSSADRIIVRDTAAWPASRVIDRNRRTVGVVFREAPPSFQTQLTVRPGEIVETVLRLDWLCMPADACRRRGLPFLDFPQRLDVCRSLVAVASVLERHTVVYGDWSYRNAFWSANDHSGFLIDLDSCGFGSRPAILSPSWEDPLLGDSHRADVATDRYGVALLLARCLTAERKRDVALTRLGSAIGSRGRQNLCQLIYESLTTPERSRRPTIEQLFRELETTTNHHAQPSVRQIHPGANVATWVAVGPPAQPGHPQFPPSIEVPAPPPDDDVSFDPYPAPCPYRQSWREVLIENALDHPVLAGFVIAAVLLGLAILIL